MDFEFETTRTSLANAFAAAGAELLGYQPLVSTAVAPIPDTQPQKYAVAGTLVGILQMAGKMMGEEVGAGLEGLTQYNLCPTGIGAEMRAAKEGRYFKVSDVERLLAARAAAEKPTGDLTAFESVCPEIYTDPERELLWKGWQLYATHAARQSQQARAAPYAYEQDNGADTELIYAAWFEHGYGKMDPECIYRPLYLASASQEGAHAARNAALEEAALAAEKVQDVYRERQSGKWPELRDDAETGAGDCVAVIRGLKTPACAEKGGA